MTNKKVLVPGPDHPITITATSARVTVTLGGQVIADSRHALTLQEASYPAVQYIPLADVDTEVLAPSDHTTHCPYKGDASHYGLRVGAEVGSPAVWVYRTPHDPVAQIRDHVAFYPDQVDSIDVHAAG